MILDASPSVRTWQFEALRIAIDRGLHVRTIAYCDNTVRPRKRARYAGYYLLALLTRRRMRSNSVLNIRDLVDDSIVREFHFEAETEGGWQRLPHSVIERFRDHDVIIRFGMNLIRDPDSVPVSRGIISYHHGDPSRFRGRPAGFYEMWAKAPTIGVIVQRLSNDLDGGSVLAAANARVVSHSYAKTLDAAAWAGIPLLSKALFEPESPSETSEVGQTYTLPTNGVVLLQILRMFQASLMRLIYGAFREKSWKVGFVDQRFDPGSTVCLTVAGVRDLPTPAGSTFVADSIVGDEKTVYCEAMDSRTGIGSIARWDVESQEWNSISLPGFSGHASYPLVVNARGSRYILPEIASQAAPTLFELDEDGRTVRRCLPLAGLEDVRVIDPTLFHHKGTWFLFGGLPATCANQLGLWSSSDLNGPYELHPDSPVCLDVRGARMAGPILVEGDNLFRFGQDNSRNYGGAVTVYRIVNLTRGRYSEREVGSVSFADSWGPHTVSLTDRGVWVDYYRESWSLLAGWRRVRAATLKRKASN